MFACRRESRKRSHSGTFANSGRHIAEEVWREAVENAVQPFLMEHSPTFSTRFCSFLHLGSNASAAQVDQNVRGKESHDRESNCGVTIPVVQDTTNSSSSEALYSHLADDLLDNQNFVVADLYGTSEELGYVLFSEIRNLNLL